MNKTKTLTDAMRVEKDLKIHTRILAVRSVLLGNTIAQTAEIANVTHRTVQMWIKRFDLDGVDGLRDSPDRGKKPKVPVGRIKKIATKLRRMGKITPKKLWQLGAPQAACHIQRGKHQKNPAHDGILAKDVNHQAGRCCRRKGCKTYNFRSFLY